MSLARLEEVASWDEDGEITGLQFDSRERRIQEWRDKKEDDEYAALFERLQKRNYQRRKVATPEGKLKAREAERRHRESGKKRARERERRRNRYKADPVICTCQECGATWCVVYEKRSQKASKYCSLRCRQRSYAVAESRRKNRGIRTMDARQQIIEYVTLHPGCESGEVAKEQGLKLCPTRTLMCRMKHEGVMVTDGGKPARYWLAAIAGVSP